MKRALVGGAAATSLILGLATVTQLGAIASPGTGLAGGQHGMGLDVAKVRAEGKITTPKTFGNMQYPRARAANAAAPDSVDLSQYALTAGDQGKVGACVTWATGYSAYGILMKEGGVQGAPMAPMFIYSQISQGNDGGTTAGVALPMLQQQGIDTKADYTQGDFDYTTQPTDAEKTNAANYKLSGFQEIPTGSGAQAAIESALAAGSPVVMGFTVRSNFMNLDSTTAGNYSYQPSGSAEGGHEVAIVGYTSQGVKIMNSWGPSWGANGYFTVPWSFFQGGDVLDLYSMGKINGGNNPPTPNPTSSPTTPDPNPTTPDPNPTTPDPYPTTPDPNPTTTTPGPAPTSGQSIVQVNASNLESTKQMAQTHPVVFLVTAPSWCGACQALDPVIKSVANSEGGKFTLAIVDEDTAGGAQQGFNVSALPTMIPWGASGEMSNPQRMVGAGDQSTVQSWVDSVISAYGNGPAPAPTASTTPAPAPTTTAPVPVPVPTTTAPVPVPVPTTTDPGPLPTVNPTSPLPTPNPTSSDDPWWWLYYLMNGGNVNNVPSGVLQQLQRGGYLQYAPSSVQRAANQRLSMLRSSGQI